MSFTRKILPAANQNQTDEASLTPVEQTVVDFLYENETELLGAVLNRVRKAKIWQPQEWNDVAIAIWGEVKRIALQKTSEIDFERQPKAWLLQVANNLVKRRRSRDLEIRNHEIPVSDTGSQGQKPDELQIFDDLVSTINQLDSFDGKNSRRHWQSWNASDASQIAKDIISREQVKKLLAPLKFEDRRIIVLAVIYELSGERLAEELNLKPSAARQQLSRALSRLRKAWTSQEDFKSNE